MPSHDTTPFQSAVLSQEYVIYLFQELQCAITLFPLERKWQSECVGLSRTAMAGGCDGLSCYSSLTPVS